MSVCPRRGHVVVDYVLPPPKLSNCPFCGPEAVRLPILWTIGRRSSICPPGKPVPPSPYRLGRSATITSAHTMYFKMWQASIADRHRGRGRCGRSSAHLPSLAEQVCQVSRSSSSEPPTYARTQPVYIHVSYEVLTNFYPRGGRRYALCECL